MIARLGGLLIKHGEEQLVNKKMTKMTCMVEPRGLPSSGIFWILLGLKEWRGEKVRVEMKILSFG